METDKSYSIVEARTHFTDVLNRAAYGKERIMITRHNKPHAYVVSQEDIELLERLEDYYDVQEATKILNNLKEDELISLEDLRKELNV